MNTSFKRLNEDWNAEPNSPRPNISIAGQLLTLRFSLNPWAYHGFVEGDVGEIAFRNCLRYRLGGTNDEGWYQGQCRFSGIAPAWGEFYEIEGELRMEEAPDDWILLDQQPMISPRHFLFYFRDHTFECDALDWSFRIIRKPKYY
jgi:hypothetical protein